MNSVTSAYGHLNCAMFPSRMTELGQVRDFIQAFCHAASVNHGSCLRLNLVVEELFTNTVKHGHRGGSDAPVMIELAARTDGLLLTYEDEAPPFNPLAYAEKVALTAHVAEHKVGGLGTVLTRELSTTADYAYLFGHNRIRLTLDR